MDRFSLSTSESHVIQYAQNLILYDCMKKRGKGIAVIDLRGDSDPESLRYGIWVLSDARKYAYSTPPETAGQRRALHLNAQPLSDQEIKQETTCLSSPAVKPLRANYITSQMIRGDIYAEVLQSPQGRGIIQPWRDCLNASGIATNGPGGNVWIPKGASYTANSANKNIAVADVQCKAKTDLVPRLANLEAQAETPFIRSHWSTLRGQQEAIAKSLVLAQSIIAAHTASGAQS